MSNTALEASAIAHHWTFDEGYTSYMLQGLARDENGVVETADLADIADIITQSLIEYEFFLFIEAGEHTIRPVPPSDIEIYEIDGRLVARFETAFDKPAQLAQRLSFRLVDPEFFVSFRLSDTDDAVVLTKGGEVCSLHVERASTLTIAEILSLPENFFSQMGDADHLRRGFENRVEVFCPR